jgi:hypothetical protein
MKALSYLLLTTLKNRILSLRKKPALLVLYGIILLGVVGMVIIYSIMPEEVEVNRSFADIRILYAIVTGVGLLFLFSFISTGLSTGSTLFSMADVGLLFVAPQSPKKILLYGLIKQAGTTFISAIFILYQVGTLKQSFGLQMSSIFYIFIIYAILIFFCQLLSIAVYIYTNGDSTKKKFIKVILGGLFLFVGVLIYLEYLNNSGDIMTSVLNVVEMKAFQFVPVIGWAVMFLSSAINGSMLYVLISLLLFLVSAIGIIILFTSGEADYYEDVLHSTEVTFNRLQDAKNGKNTIYSMKKVKVKEKQTGMKGGKGHSAIFYKHLLEIKRSSRFTYIDNYTIFTTVGAAVLCKIINEEFAVYIVLGILVYIQFFMTILGRLSMELSKPYIYLIPEKSLKKVVSASLTTLMKPWIDGVFIFTATSIVSNTSPLLNLFLAIAYASSGAIFVSYALLCQRIFGGQPNKFISAMVGIGLFMVVIAPGIGASITAIMMLPQSLVFLGTLPFTFCCIVITIFVFVVCGDILDKAEYSGK